MLLKIMPMGFNGYPSYQQAKGRGKDQSHLTGAVKGITSKKKNGHTYHQYQQYDR
jgi:hypothetical protein